MGSIAVVFLLLAAGVMVGRLAGRSALAQYIMALVAAVTVSTVFLLLAVYGR